MPMPNALKEYTDEKSLTRLFQGMLAGFVLVGLFGFGWFGTPNMGFTKGGTAKEMAQQARKDGQISVLALGCARDVQQRPDAAAMKTKFESATDAWDFSRVFDTEDAKKLATMPGESYPDRDLAHACGKAVLAAGKTASIK
jgi:hypothetical protein